MGFINVEKGKTAVESEGHERLFDVVSRMESTDDVGEMQELIPKFLEDLKDSLDIELLENVEVIYQDMEKENVLVRLENIGKVVRSLAEGEPIQVGGGDDYYANAVTADNEGLAIAFAEGEAPGPIRLLIGFDVKTAIAFDPEGLDVQDIDTDKIDLRDKIKRAAHTRHVSGSIRPEKIHFLVLRIPRSLFPKDKLTQEEINGGGRSIFRGARINIVEHKGELAA